MTKLGYSYNDFIGIAGVEKTMEKYLTSNTSDRRGTETIEVNKHGTVTRELDRTAAADPTNATYTPSSGTYDTTKVAGSVLSWSGNTNAGEYALTGDLYTTSQQGYLISYNPNSKLTITPKTLTASLTGTVEKVYDGTTTATLTSTNFSGLSGVIAGDAVVLNNPTSVQYVDKNVGNGKAVAVSGLSLTGDAAGNYTLASTLSGNVGKITPATLTITAATDSKIYDGTTSSSVAPTVSGLVGGDTANGLTQAYDNKRVSGNKTLSVSGYTINDGNNGNNYTVVTAANHSGAISKAALTVSYKNGTTVEKVYDGTATATLTNANFSVSGAAVGDEVLFTGIGSYDNKNVGNNKNVTMAIYTPSGADAGNYYVDGSIAGSISGVITARPLTASVSVADKVYDGTTAATISGGITLGNFVAGDNVSAFYTSGAFGDKNVGSNKTVTLNGIALGGGDAGNYSLAANSITSSAGITPATLTTGLTGSVEKVYNSTAAATLTGANYSALSGIIGGDDVTLAIATSGQYSDKNVGDGKAVSVSGLGLSGSAASNYQLASTSLNANIGKITPARLTITATTNSKDYDGTLSAAATPMVSGTIYDASILGETYDNKNAGSGKALTPVITFVNASDAAHYSLTTVADTTAVIAPASLTITANNAGKIVGAPNPAFSAVYSGLVAGETVADLTGVLQFATPATQSSAAGSYAIIPSGQTSGNYHITYVDGVLTVAQQPDPYTAAVMSATSLFSPPLIGGTGSGMREANGPSVTGTQNFVSAGGPAFVSPIPGLPLTITGSGINTSGFSFLSSLNPGRQAED